jgi:ribosomal protein S18 acetylase RimI-like enzyme
MEIRVAYESELDDVVAFITEQQRDPACSTSYLIGEEPDRVRAELEALEPDWTQTVRVTHRDGILAGAVVVEIDEELGRGWILGPWVAGDDWDTHAPQLVDAALAQLPAGVTQAEVSALLENTRLQELAEARGWQRSNEHHALVVTEAIVDEWPDPSGVRLASADDLPAIEPLHEASFPNTHTPAARLFDKMTVLVARDNGDITGYVAGQVQPDGEGYIDYLAVDPARRGQGTGKKLVMALAKPLLDLSPAGVVALTVDGENAPARALYASLGFETDSSFVAYRNF